MKYTLKFSKESAQKGFPPKGFMTGDEFERRVKERVTKFYRENGIIKEK